MKQEISVKDLMDQLEKNLFRMIDGNKEELEQRNAENAKSILAAFERIDQHKLLHMDIIKDIERLKTTMAERDAALEKSLETKIRDQGERVATGETKIKTLSSLIGPLVYILTGGLITLILKKLFSI